jgi:hypothetical protein
MAYDKTTIKPASKDITIEQKLHITDPVNKKFFYKTLLGKDPGDKYAGKLVNTSLLKDMGYEIMEGGQN